MSKNLIPTDEIPLALNYYLQTQIYTCTKMIPAEVESLQSQLVDLQLAVDEFFAILLSMYDLDLCKESFKFGSMHA